MSRWPPRRAHLRRRAASGPFSTFVCNVSVQRAVARDVGRLTGTIALAIVLLAPGSSRAEFHHDTGLGSEVADGVSGGERGAALEALERWDLPAARAAFARLGAPQAPSDLLLASRLAFYAGEYAEAVRLLALVPPAVAALEPVAAYARLAAASLALDGRLAVKESEHFELHFDAELDWVLAEPALAALEAGYRAIGAWLGERAPQKVRVEIVAVAADFERVSGLEREQIETSGAVGVSAFNKIMVLSPRLLLRGYPWRDTLNHEYLHYLIVRLSANRAPIWLQEGLARSAEARWRTAAAAADLDDLERSLLARALRENQLIPFSAMDGSLLRLPSPGAVRLAAAECAFAVDYLIEGWGVGSVGRLLAELARTPPSQGQDPALEAVIGEPFARFESGWRRLLEQRGFREVAGIVVPPYRLAGTGDAETWDLAEWQPLAAQSHLRLGDLLRARGNARAGLMEFEKARAAAPASPYAQVKTARALLELGRAEEAATAARAAVRLARGYPAANLALAAALAALGDHESEVEALRAALEINPFDYVAWRDLGRALRHLGRVQEAQQASVAALRLAPRDEKFQRSVMQDE